MNTPHCVWVCGYVSMCVLFSVFLLIPTDDMGHKTFLSPVVEANRETIVMVCLDKGKINRLQLMKLYFLYDLFLLTQILWQYYPSVPDHHHLEGWLPQTRLGRNLKYPQRVLDFHWQWKKNHRSTDSRRQKPRINFGSWHVLHRIKDISYAVSSPPSSLPFRHMPVRN